MNRESEKLNTGNTGRCIEPIGQCMERLSAWTAQLGLATPMEVEDHKWRRSLVPDRCLTGETVVCGLIDGTPRQNPVARITVEDTPYLK